MLLHNGVEKKNIHELGDGSCSNPEKDTTENAKIIDIPGIFYQKILEIRLNRLIRKMTIIQRDIFARYTWP